MRLPHYDYSQNGAYFITLCTHNRDCVFGNVVDGGMVLNKAGQIVESVWQDLPTHYPDIFSDAFIIMPNHVHFILFVGAIHESPELPHVNESPELPTVQPMRAVHEPPLRYPTQPPLRSLLSKCVGRFKMQTAKQINQHQQTPGLSVWQRGYYDHIVRNDADLTRIRDYIANNPAQWELDENNPSLYERTQSPPTGNVSNVGAIHESPELPTTSHLRAVHEPPLRYSIESPLQQ
jgi:putative transposase